MLKIQVSHKLATFFIFWKVFCLFQKWTKKMSKIENPKHFLEQKNYENLTNNIINSQNNLKNQN